MLTRMQRRALDRDRAARDRLRRQLGPRWYRKVEADERATQAAASGRTYLGRVGLGPGVRVVDGEALYSADWLQDELAAA